MAESKPQLTHAVVTGASSGIGRAFAQRLGEAAASVTLVGRDPGRLEIVAAEVAMAGGEAQVRATDLADDMSLRALEQRLAESEVDLLVNAAGLAHVGKLAQLERDQSERQVRVNVIALMCLSQAVLPGMIARGRGAIINVSSLMAYDDRPGWTPYLASKVFVTRLTENLAVELDGTGVIVQALCPGPVRDTQFFSRAGFDSATFPPQVMMSGGDVVDASLAALARHELCCVPGLQDPEAIERHRLARLHLLAEGRHGTLAARYRTELTPSEPR